MKQIWRKGANSAGIQETEPTARADRLSILRSVAQFPWGSDGRPRLLTRMPPAGGGQFDPRALLVLWAIASIHRQ